MSKRRRWEMLALGVALMVTFVILVVIGTQRPGGASNTLVGKPSPQGSSNTDVAPRPWMRKLNAGEKPPQFVVFSFDGAGSHEHWQKMMKLADGVDARFSGFLSGIYLLDDSRRTEYTGPGHKPGKASIGFGGSPTDVTNLIGDLNQAVEQGHEIGTHYNGHFCKGSEPSVGRWDAAQWNSELDQFFKFMDDARAKGLKVDPRTVKGGRTPCLEGQFDIVMPTLAAREMTYDSSQVTDGLAWPTQQSGVWEFAMPTVRVPGANYRKTILMDYNFWFLLNKAKDEPARAPEFAKITLDTYEGLYQAAFNGNRAPMVVGNHFNNWSGGGFMTAVEQFMGSVCTRPDTACATYTEVIDWMKLQDPAVLDSYRKLPNAQIEAPA
ncbi:putative secreted protein [Alloactinosynnema sp. L-07]|uniref:polysaccharide deacetylase n=1 Tax=Alloactinosynnema sp. L-07 TaxID=1653480 RepID=UPI00065F0627|nr:polysaccharide deacetylase [Alloactinosynnema sp. L-07]CRK61558.1 putative secreted protein [Alloactinosynnema sp. L-07]